MAFERARDAKNAIAVVCRNNSYTPEGVETCETNGASLSTQFGGADIGVDFCVVGDDSELGIARSVLLKRRENKIEDVQRARIQLERDFSIDHCEEGGCV